MSILLNCSCDREDVDQEVGIADEYLEPTDLVSVEAQEPFQNIADQSVDVLKDDLTGIVER